MKKISKAVFLILFFITINFELAAQAQQSEANVGDECVDCKKAADQGLVNVQEHAADLLSHLQQKKPYECEKQSDPGCTVIRWMKWKEATYAANCKGFFLDEKGNLGSFSRLNADYFFKDMKANGEQSVFVKNSKQLEDLCPGFSNFSPLMKSAFHGWIFELLAFPESSCVLKTNAAGVNSRAVCLYQLEGDYNHRQWRGPGCRISNKQIMTLEGCTGCAMQDYTRKMKADDDAPFGTPNETETGWANRAQWASFNPLFTKEEACLEKYSTVNPKTGKREFPKQGKKYLFQLKCKSYNGGPASVEWMARYKFFHRIKRFPLCNTDAAKKELEDLAVWEQGKTTK